MRLLIVTQVIDIDHPILGFFHRWVLEFAQQCEQVHVICLQAGKHSLPANVTVHSLGKEDGENRLKYLWRFYTYTWQLRHEYDNVFVHMNQVYVLLGGLLWRLSGKRIGLWYMHGTVSRSLRLAEKLTHVILTGSPESCRIKSHKIIVTGHGVDIDHFSRRPVSRTHDFVTVGRITPSKNLRNLVTYLEPLLRERQATLIIAGAAVTEAEQAYEATLVQHIAELGLTDAVQLVGRVSQEALPELLSASACFVTTAQNGSLDKVILEAMACELPVVSMALGSQSLNLGPDQVTTPEQFTMRAGEILDAPAVNSRNRDLVVQNHSLQSLIPKICSRLR